MIDTSSHRALREVVLQLCKTSPALSGALARGLAPRSSWARSLMQQAGSQTRIHHTIKTEPRASEQDAWAHNRLTQRPGSNKASQNSTSQSRTHHHPTERQNEDCLRLPPIKLERRPSLANSDDSNTILDLSAIGRVGLLDRQPSHQHVPAGSSARDRSHANPEPSHRDVTGSDKSRRGLLANPAVQGPSARPRSTHLSAPDHKPKLCLQCHELVGEENDSSCSYHPGEILPAKRGDVPKYACCDRFEGEPGCKSGRHVSEKTGTYTNNKRPSPSPDDFLPWLKRPRHL
jgi:hypothetical protein